MRNFVVVERHKCALYHGEGNMGTMVNNMRISTGDPMPDEADANTDNPMLEIKSVVARV